MLSWENIRQTLTEIILQNFLPEFFKSIEVTFFLKGEKTEKLTQI